MFDAPGWGYHRGTMLNSLHHRREHDERCRVDRHYHQDRRDHDDADDHQHPPQRPTRRGPIRRAVAAWCLTPHAGVVPTPIHGQTATTGAWADG